MKIGRRRGEGEEEKEWWTEERTEGGGVFGVGRGGASEGGWEGRRGRGEEEGREI